MTTQAFALAAGRRYELRNAAICDEDLTDVPALPATAIIVEVRDDHFWKEAILDGDPVSLARGSSDTTGLLLYDAFQSVGYHRLEVGSSVFLFATEDAKLGIAGIRQMLDYLESEGLSWGGQLFFSGGGVIRDWKIDYAWLEARGREVLAAAESISARPLRRFVADRQRGRPTGAAVIRSETLRLIRRAGHRVLDSIPGGPIEMLGSSYAPREVIQTRSVSSLDITGNRRVVELLRLTRELALRIHLLLPRRKRSVATDLADACTSTLSRYPYSLLERHRPLLLPDGPAPEEQADPRYSRSFELYDALTRELSWSQGRSPTAPFAYVRSADLLYQAFVALTIAQALNAKQRAGPLTGGLTEPMFRSDSVDIYYDTVPPRDLLTNWRSKSTCPSDMRPDLLLHDRSRNRSLLLDAKYRVEPSGNLSSSALRDCHVYMQSFSVRAIVACYPGPTFNITRVAAEGNCILQVPLVPAPGLQAYLRSDAIPAILALM